MKHPNPTPPKATTTSKKVPSGAARLRKSGRKAVMLTVTPEQLEVIREGARLTMRPVSQFATWAAISAALEAVRVNEKKQRQEKIDPQAILPFQDKQP